MTALPVGGGDEQYLDELPDYKTCGMDKTPGFRAFMLDDVETIGERPRGGDLCSMHIAYKAGLEHAATASGWQDAVPGPGKWWMSMLPAKLSKSAVVSVVVDGLGFVHHARTMQVMGNIAEGTFIKSKWKRRDTPADPFIGDGT